MASEPVFLTAGAVESVDDSEVARVRADGVLKKPFEASLLLEAVGRFNAPKRLPPAAPAGGPAANPGPPRAVVVLDPDQVRAAVTVALDAAMPGLVDEISARVLSALTGVRARPQIGRLTVTLYFPCPITVLTSSRSSKCRR